MRNLDSQTRLTRRQFIGGAVATVASLPAWPTQLFARLGSQRPLWSARKGHGVVYIVGETWPQPGDWHDPVVEGLLGRCGRLWTETNQIYRRPTKDLIEAFGKATDASSLKQLSPAQQSRLLQAAASCGVSLKDLSDLRPWLAGAALEDAFYAKTGLTGKSAREILLAQAEAAGIPVSSEFATKDDVFAWMGGFSPNESTQFLCYEMDCVLLGRTGMAQVSSDWLAGRTGPASAFVDHVRRAYPELYVKLTLDRNRAWVPRFESMVLDSTPTMVIIGMFHLVGQDNVLTQLRQNGYDIVHES
jgi:uncharacterized protein YbaP (TraB family)